MFRLHAVVNSDAAMQRLSQACGSENDILANYWKHVDIMCLWGKLIVPSTDWIIYLSYANVTSYALTLSSLMCSRAGVLGSDVLG